MKIIEPMHHLWLIALQWIQLHLIKSVPNRKLPMIPFPRDWGDDALSKHMSFVINNALITFIHDKPSYEALAFIDRKLSVIYNYYRNFQQPLLFFTRVYFGYRTACQLVISGQITESYPIMRMCIESSLYALHTSKNDSAFEVWINRDEDDTSKKVMLSEFAMQKLQSTLKSINPKLSKTAQILYEQCIDLGAHPNPQGIFQSMEVNNEPPGIYIDPLHSDSGISEGMKFVKDVGVTCLLIFVEIFPESLGHEKDTFFEELRQYL